MGTKKMSVGGIISNYGMYIAFTILFVLLSTVSPAFLTSTNIINILRQISVIGTIAIGMTFVIATGGIDLSVGAIVGLSGVVSTSLVAGESGMPLILSIMAGVGVGICRGMFWGPVFSKGGGP